MLGPLSNQTHISVQLHKRCARFLYSMNHSNNYIVSSCFSNAVQNASTPLGHNISFFRYEYSIDVMSYKLCDYLKLISPQTLSRAQCDSITQIKQLLLIRSGSHYIEGFSYHDIDQIMIDCITTQ